MSKVKISDWKEDGNRVTFKLKGVPVTFANALRRSIMNRVPVYAIDEITVYENTSAFFDEYIANRVGMIPIVTPDKFDEEVMFSVNAEGPTVIMSGSLEPSNPKVHVATKEIPIIELANKQTLRIEGVARKKTGKVHAKFQGGIASYEYTEEGEYTFIVESFGQMDASELIKRSLRELINK
ncbi:MAG: DNA-directed RNA polymerase subunit D, partial [Candidatus Micrarchaeia archaeon]